MDDEERDFQADVKINRLRLDVECESQPELFSFYAGALAECRSERDSLREKLKLTRADVELEARRNPPDDLKVTESVIAALVETDKRVISVKDHLGRVEHTFNGLDAIVTAFEHRRSMLNNLVELFGKEYFSIPDHRPEEKAQREARANLNRKRRSSAGKD
jgi:hypothetical protein